MSHTHTQAQVSVSSPFASYICPEYDPFANVSEEQTRIRKQKLINRLQFILANMPRKFSRNASEIVHTVIPKKPSSLSMYCASAGVLASGRKRVTFAVGTKSESVSDATP